MNPTSPLPSTETPLLAGRALPGAAAPLSGRKGLLCVAGAVLCFHLAFSVGGCVYLIVGFLWCLLQLSRLPSTRQVFYTGSATGMLIYSPQLSFFWDIFHGAAIALWLVLSFWIALFLLLARLAQQKLRRGYAAVLIPFLWLGLECFRSELYYLRFSWLSVGYAFSSLERGSTLGMLGVYGTGFVLMAVAVLLSERKKTALFSGLGLLVLLAGLGSVPKKSSPGTSGSIRVAGVQLEFREEDVVDALERVHQKLPNTDLYVLSEYTFADPPPKTVKKWCRDHKAYLIAGGKDFLDDGIRYYNTAFVVGPDGEFVFKQGKSVPIQFFKDGLPAPKQDLWNSPWGKIGICICYDLSYRKVVDHLVSMGAQALVIPTMDMAGWGLHQHELHGRIAPMRASEYGIPIFRLCSSGISQAVDEGGVVIASAPFPGEGEILSATLPIRGAGRLPIDHWLAPISSAVSALFVLWLALSRFLKRSHPQKT